MVRAPTARGFGSRPVGGGRRGSSRASPVPASRGRATPTSGSTISSLPPGSGAFPAALRRGPSAGRRPRAGVAFSRASIGERAKCPSKKASSSFSFAQATRMPRFGPLSSSARYLPTLSAPAGSAARREPSNCRRPSPRGRGASFGLCRRTCQRRSNAGHRHCTTPTVRLEPRAGDGRKRVRREETSLDVSTRGARGRLRHPCPFNASVYPTL
jgi:hypothetical protein